MNEKVHELKCQTKYYGAILLSHKTFDVRKNDRNFKVGEYITLKEWDNEKNEFTGNSLSRRINYILPGGQFGIEKGYCVLGIA